MRLAYISDIHFPDHDKRAWNLTLNILPELNLDKICGGGDWFDLEQLSRFPVKPNRMMMLERDVKNTIEQLAILRDCIPDVPIKMIGSNHGDRYEKIIVSKVPQIAGLKGHSVAEIFQYADFDIEHVPRERTYREGKLLFIHGDEVRIGSVDLARKLYFKVNENVIAGHYHAQDSYIHTLGGSLKNEGAWVNSCLRRLRPDWAPFSHWTLGFTIVDFSIGGFFHVQQVLYLKRGSRLWAKVDNVEYWS